MCAHCGHSHRSFTTGELDADRCDECLQQLVILEVTGTNDGTELECRDFDH